MGQPPTKFDVDKVSIPAKMSTNARVKPGQLWSKGRDDLKKQLDELKTELGQLRVQKIAGSASSKLNRIHDLRKSIARVLTVDLRPKQTRAIRRRLSKKDASRTTEKQKKRSTHFPQRKYAVKAEA